ncbi:MAG: penicillin-binding transpeptidase domain-containing protein [Alistipes sp.]|nr:penicillin-binding transpeptidase domain-containing protein [Alistipes sp.]
MASNNNVPSRSMKFRVRVTMTTVFIVLFAVVVGNFFRISVLNNEKYEAMANDQHFGSIPISAHRGSIYDANGTALAKSATVYNVFLDPQKFREEMESLQTRIDQRTIDIASGAYVPKIEETTNEDGTISEQKVVDQLPASSEIFRQEAIALLCEKLGIETEEVEKAMAANNQYSVLQKKVEKPVADEVLGFFNQYGLTSLNVEEDTKRYYPHNELAAAVIGFTAADGYGLYGLEASYDEYLAGTDGRTISAKDSHGNELPYRYSKTYPAQNGCDIYLTIDSQIQHYLEKRLEEMSTEFQVLNRSVAILMNAKTGAVYGMAQYPSYDPNNPYDIADPKYAAMLTPDLSEEEYNRIQGEARETQWRNKSITETYEPGSVFKVITSASAIEEQAINVDTDRFYCSGSIEIEGHFQPVHCHNTAGHDSQTFQQALTNSCNPAFIEVGKKLGIENFLYYYDAFGLREPTGIDLLAESSSNQHTIDTMTNVDLCMSAIGQTETVTPMEMITAYCAAINGGYLLQPYVVEKVVDEDGNVVLKNERTVRRQVISEETSEIMRNALYNVAVDSNVAIKGYSIGGKSGTSQRFTLMAEQYEMDANKEEDSSIQMYGSSYCCFTPADDPEIILLVIADNPDHKNNGGYYYGSKIAVPTARDILTDVLPYLGISPEYSDDELANLDIKVPLLEGDLEAAKKTLTDMGANPEVVGEGTTVVAQSPVTGTSIAKGGTVYLYTDPSHTVDYTEVPDVVGLSPSVANESITYMDLNYVTTGASVTREGAAVNAQNPPAGTKVAVGSTVELEIMVYEQGD